MAKTQLVTEGDILKGILKQRRMTQEQLATRIGYGRTKLNLALGMSVLDTDLKRKVVEALGLPEDTFPERAVEEPEAAPSTFFAELNDKIDLVLQQQKTILQLLQKQQ